MVVRVWRGRTPEALAGRYLQFLLRGGLSGYRETPGFLGVDVLTRSEGRETEFMLASRWRDMRAVRAFAGPEPERPVYYPEDDEFLLEREPRVRHYEVAHEVPAAEGA